MDREYQPWQENLTPLISSQRLLENVYQKVTAGPLTEHIGKWQERKRATTRMGLGSEPATFINFLMS